MTTVAHKSNEGDDGEFCLATSSIMDNLDQILDSRYLYNKCVGKVQFVISKAYENGTIDIVENAKCRIVWFEAVYLNPHVKQRSDRA